VFWLRSNILPSICIAELELVPLPNHSNERVAYAFFDKVLNMFGAPAKVLINQSTKFHGEFQGLCEKTFINHCMTSRNHLEVDGLVERMVQTMKWGL
jgi:transposase-like protein